MHVWCQLREQFSQARAGPSDMVEQQAVCHFLLLPVLALQPLACVFDIVWVTLARRICKAGWPRERTSLQTCRTQFMLPQKRRFALLKSPCYVDVHSWRMQRRFLESAMGLMGCPIREFHHPQTCK